MPSKDYSNYISESALDAIYVMEGHFDGAKNPTGHNGKKEKLTTYYGITEDGLYDLRRLKSAYSVDVPNDLLKADVKSLSEKQARDVAGYLAMYYTKEFDSQYDDGIPYFYNLPLNVRSGVLSVVMNGGLKAMKQAYKDNPKGCNVLNAAKTGSRENVGVALMCKNANQLMDEPYQSPKRGRVNRILAGIRLMYDTNNNSFKDVDSRDKVYDEWLKDKHVVQRYANHMRNIELANKVKQYQDDDIINTAAFYEDNPGTSAPMAEQTKSQAPREDQTKEKPGVITKLTNGVKKLFTNSNEQENANVAERGQDVNMQ